VKSAGVLIGGVDLAWGERQPDGVCLARIHRGFLQVEFIGLSRGDEALLALLAGQLDRHGAAFLALDAPVVCPNETGSRPVDREAQKIFRRYHAGPHPCNRRLCPRPLRLVEKLKATGFAPGWETAQRDRLLAEVFPHPALVRWGGLERTIKYKRGPVPARRAEFKRLQTLIRQILCTHFSDVLLGPAVDALLARDWSKGIEDQTDAFLCLLMAWQHWRSGGTETQVLGSLETGFLLVPRSGDSP
jgi:predicted RNase H-like nuclease